MTLDEARAATAASAWRLVDDADTHNPIRLGEMLWARDRIVGLSARDRRLTRRHRDVLDHVTALGFYREACDELDGVASALGLPDVGARPSPVALPKAI
jgi:hypothetical protein